MKKNSAGKLPPGTEINNVRLVNNQSAGRKRRDVNDFAIQIDITLAGDSGPTIDVDLNNAIEQNGGAFIEVDLIETGDTSNTNGGTASGGSGNDNGGSGSDNGGASTDNGGSSTDNGNSGTDNAGSQGRILLS